MPKTRALILILAVSMAACSTLTVSSDWDHTVDFSRYKTFALREGTKATASFIQDRIDRGVMSALQSKGLTPSPDASLLVYTHARVTKEKQIDYNTWGYGGYYGWRGWGRGRWATTTATVREIPVGTLIIDLVDAEKKELVWRGTAQDTISGDPKDVSQEKIDSAIAKVFAGFPPAAPR